MLYNILKYIESQSFQVVFRRIFQWQFVVSVVHRFPTTPEFVPHAAHRRKTVQINKLM